MSLNGRAVDTGNGRHTYLKHDAARGGLASPLALRSVHGVPSDPTRYVITKVVSIWSGNLACEKL